jgi:hypothetical protein
MVILVVLNIILIILLIFLILYLFKNKEKDNIKDICDKHYNNEEIENENHKLNKKIKYERVYDGRFITDDEYQQMKNLKKSDISILLENVNREYEHLKELSNEGTERYNKR